MTERSLKASPEGIQKAKQALKRNFLTQKALAEDVGLVRSTVSNFFAGKAIDRINFQEICKELGLNWQEIVVKPEPDVYKNSDFVGREKAIAHLNTIYSQGAKVIGVYGKGGIGKTTLAHQYFRSHNLKYLDLYVGIESNYITPIESWIRDRLRYDFDQEPRGDFLELIDQLKQQLQFQKIGILIDNLETALDEKGKLKSEHRGYVELLNRVLGHPNIQSITLITSRERLNESKLSFIEPYVLPELDLDAWKDFFRQLEINVDSPAFSEMHKAYGGNALAMKVLRSSIHLHYNENFDNYWQNNKKFLLKGEIQDLIASQFDYLQDDNLQAYQLLCRLGIYNYQEIPKIPTIGLWCLLWDVSEQDRHLIIESLQNRYLIEYEQGEYWLHSIIYEESKKRLKLSKLSLDQLLISMKTEVDIILANYKDLQSLLIWINKCFDGFSKPYKPVAAKAYSLILNLSNNLELTSLSINQFTQTRALNLATILDPELNRLLEPEFQDFQDILNPNDYFNVMKKTCQKSMIFFGEVILRLNFDYYLDCLLKAKIIEQNKQYSESDLLLILNKIFVLAINRYFDVNYIREMHNINNFYNIIDQEISKSKKENFKIDKEAVLKKIYSLRKNNKLNKTVNNYRTNLLNIRKLTQDETAKLKEYYDANFLLVHCLKLASDEVRSQIEESLFCPVVEE